MKRLIILTLFIILCTACSTIRYKEVPVPVETVNTEYINKFIHDSIYVRDSIDRYRSGDTVFLEKYRYIYRDKLRTDTVIKCDSIPYLVTVRETEVKEVNKLKWYQEILMVLGAAFLAVAIYKVKTLIKK